MKAIGLFFGSFNPVHVGHMIIANMCAQSDLLDEVWMVVSPQNPFKKKQSLAPDRERLHLLNLAIGDNTLLRASDVEFSLPTPSYTIDTLTVLKEKYPKYEFYLMIGGDNLASLPKWKNFDTLISHNKILVYPRPGYELGELANHENVHILDQFPLLDISASEIRSFIQGGKSVRYLIPDAVFDYIDGSNLYR